MVFLQLEYVPACTLKGDVSVLQSADDGQLYMLRDDVQGYVGRLRSARIRLSQSFTCESLRAAHGYLWR